MSPCPACGKAVDSLRAGHVAMLETGFAYFCDLACKKKWAEGIRSSLEGVTAEPPSVTARPASVVPSGVRETPREPPPETLRSSDVPPPPEPEVPEPEEESAEVDAPAPVAADEVDEEEAPAPSFPRAKAPSEPPPVVAPKQSLFSSRPKPLAKPKVTKAPKKKVALDWLGWMPVVGIVLGAFACVVSLAG